MQFGNLSLIWEILKYASCGLTAYLFRCVSLSVFPCSYLAAATGLMPVELKALYECAVLKFHRKIHIISTVQVARLVAKVAEFDSFCIKIAIVG